MTNHIGVAPLTMARTQAGGYVNIYAGDPVPDGIKADDLKRLVDDGFLGKVKDEAPADSGTDTVAGILDEVGDSKELAHAALLAENAKARPRKGLVEALEKILAA